MHSYVITFRQLGVVPRILGGRSVEKRRGSRNWNYGKLEKPDWEEAV
jgi:hypothetical protein